MKKTILIGTLALSILLSVTGCGKEQQQETVVETVAENKVAVDTVTVKELEHNQIQFEDALGRELTVEDPQRVVTMLGSFTDIWKLAGGEVVATVKDSWTNFDLNLDESVINLGSHGEPDLELLLSTEPDFIIASANLDAQVALKDSLEKAGITVAYFDVSNFEDYLTLLDLFTQITNKQERYEEYGTKVAEQITEVKKRVDDSHPRILFLRASASGGVKVKETKNSVGGEMLVDLGCINIADSDESLLEDLSMEAIIAADPDYIFVTTQGSDESAALQVVKETLEDNPAWSALTAVKNGNYHILDKRLYNAKPNARWGEAYQMLADILY